MSFNEVSSQVSCTCTLCSSAVTRDDVKPGDNLQNEGTAVMHACSASWPWLDAALIVQQVLMHQTHIGLIAEDPAQRATCNLQEKQVNYFPALSLSLCVPLQKRALWDGCDETEQAESNLPSVCTITFI